MVSTEAVTESGAVPAGAAAAAAEPPFARELADWLPSNDEPVRPLVALASLGLDGYPDLRHVLLSEFDERGFFFHTDSRSRKIVELTASPRASFTVAWPELGRQLTVVGDTEHADEASRARVYAKRTPYLKLLAHLNDPAFARLALDDRLTRWADFAAAHPAGTLTPPATWAGILLRPRRVTLWHGRPDTASRRTEHTREGGTWSTVILPG